MDTPGKTWVNEDLLSYKRACITPRVFRELSDWQTGHATKTKRAW